MLRLALAVSRDIAGKPSEEGGGDCLEVGGVVYFVSGRRRRRGKAGGGGERNDTEEVGELGGGSREDGEVGGGGGGRMRGRGLFFSRGVEGVEEGERSWGSVVVVVVVGEGEDEPVRVLVMNESLGRGGRMHFRFDGWVVVGYFGNIKRTPQRWRSKKETDGGG